MGVSGLISDDATVSIPAYIDGQKVLALGQSGSTECITGAEDITTLNLSDAANLKVIEDHAFENCTSLSTIASNTVEKVGTYAFKYCILLERADLSVCETVGVSAFYMCMSLTEVILSDEIKYIPDNCFSCCQLKTVTCYETDGEGNVITDESNNPKQAVKNGVYLPNVETVGAWAFSGDPLQDCYKNAIKSVNLPKCETVELGAFTYCTSLETVVLSDDITSIPGHCFGDCSQLEVVTTSSNLNEDGTPKVQGAYLPNVTEVAGYAFNGCTSLASANLPACTTVGYYAFSGCTSLASANLPACTTVGDYAFSGCKSLATITLKPGCTEGTDAFDGCPAEKVYN